jgi:hypothetical protein
MLRLLKEGQLKRLSRFPCKNKIEAAVKYGALDKK